MIQERVLVPRQRIVWWLHGWSHGPVLVADRESVLLFDIEKRELHTISTKVPASPTYVMHKIFKLFTERGKVGADIHFSPHQTIQSVANVEGAALAQRPAALTGPPADLPAPAGAARLSAGQLMSLER